MRILSQEWRGNNRRTNTESDDSHRRTSMPEVIACFEILLISREKNNVKIC